MKKSLFFSFAFLVGMFVYGQWTPIPIGTATTEVSSMTSYVDTVLVGFAGDGIFKTTDLGNSWTDVSGNLSNKNINTIQAGPWPFVFVSTTTGPFYTLDQQSYMATPTTGLSNTNVNFYFVGGELEENDFSVGTLGGGFYTGPELDGPWTAANNGLSGDALTINSLSGYDYGDSSTYILATNGGVYYSNNEFNSWTSGNNGLSGDQLKVTGAMLLNTFSVITTEGGAYYSLDMGMSWTPIFENEKFNLLHLQISQSGAFTVFLLGETSYVSTDFQTWIPIPTPGEVISATTTTTELFIATASSKNSSQAATSGIFRQPISWTLTSLPESQSKNDGNIFKQNYPNPFSGSTTLSYTLSADQWVNIRVYDMLGKEVMSLIHTFQTAGNHEYLLEGQYLKPGIYTVILTTEETASGIKIVKE